MLSPRIETDSLVIGFVACDENYRRQGITKKLMKVNELPEVSQMIITRALEKKVIVKEDTHTWYDSYIVNDV